MNKVRLYDCCIYPGCVNGKHNNKHLFCFPKHTDSRLQKWITNIGNPKLLNLSVKTIRRYGICADHFGEECFNKSTEKPRLLPNAVPIVYIPVSQHAELKVVREETATEDLQYKNVRPGPGSGSGIEPSQDTGSASIIGSYAAEKATEIDPVYENSPVLSNNDEEYDVLFHQNSTRTYSRKLHFESDDNPSNMLDWLNTDYYSAKKVSSERKVSQRNAVTQTDPIVSKNTTFAFEQKKKMELNLKRLEKENRILRNENSRLRLKIRRHTAKLRNTKPGKRGRPKKKVANIDDVLQFYGCTNPTAIAMVKLQLHKPYTTFEQDEKDLAKKLYYHSAAAYTRLRKAGCNFPGESTVRKWISEYDIKPGFCGTIFERVKQKICQLPKDERLCALKWDEMSIKGYEEYSAKFDCIEGLIDLGPLGRADEKARHIMVFCLDSINAKNPWRQPLCYFLTGSGMNSEDITCLVHDCLRLLDDIGADVRFVTCDQCTSNQTSFSHATRKSLNVNKIDGEFEFGGKKYQATYDFPHLIKRLIALLRTHKRIYIGDQVIVEYNDFLETWKFDSALTTSQLLSHITEAHMNPNFFEAMNVKRAFQILSHTFANAIQLAGQDANGLTSDTWQASADFAARMNEIIDVMNVYRLSSNKNSKRPLTPSDEHAKILLSDFSEWCEQWSLIPTSTTSKRKHSSLKRIPCMNGLTMTVQSVLKGYDKILEDHRLFVLATGLINQDSVEHLFSKLRQRGGHNPNPTSRMVRLSLRHILSTGYIHSSDKGNVTCSESHSLITEISNVSRCFELSTFPDPEPLQEEEDKMIDISENEISRLSSILNRIEDGCDNSDDINLNEVNDETEVENDVSYEENAIAYLAGYIARKVHKNECRNCHQIMSKTPMEFETTNEAFIRLQEFDTDDEDAPTVTKLTRPTESFVQIIKIQLESFKNMCKVNWKEIGLLGKLLEECMKSTSILYPTWFDEKNTCYSHRVEAAKCLLCLKIFAETRKRNHEFKRKMRNNQSGSRKLKKIKGT